MNKIFKYILVVTGLILIISIVFILISGNNKRPKVSSSPAKSENDDGQDNLMFIESLRKRQYPISEIVIEETLDPGLNYNRYIASYKSDGLKIYGLLTVPVASKPEKGFPTIIFLHGFVNPKTYVTTEDYVASQDGLARGGFITYKPDLRGHGRSEGVATGAHFSEAYVVDTINAIAALKKFKDTDPQKIGVWGHSNGGEIGLRTMVVSKDIKAGVFWAGVVGSFEDMLETYNAKIPFMRRSVPELVKKYSSPSANPQFWSKIDPYYYLKDISGPIELHHGTVDEQVPIELSRHLKDALLKEGKTAELYEYEGANHNFSGSAFGLSMQRTVEFFRTNL